MIMEDKIEQLLAGISELEKQVKMIKLEDESAIQTLSECCHITFSLLEQIKELEYEKIKMMNICMTEQQEEMKRLNSLFLQYKSSAEMYKENIKSHLSETVKEETQLADNVGIEDAQRVENTVEETIAETDKCDAQHEAEDKVKESVTTEVTEEKNTTLSLNDVIEKRQLSDFRKAFSLNDRFRFRRELFGGNEECMSKAITRLNEIKTYDESIAYIKSELHWNMEDEAVIDFIKLLERRFF